MLIKKSNISVFYKERGFHFIFSIYLLYKIIFLLPQAHAAGLFSEPIKCNYGEDCFIQNYVDLDKITGVFFDYNCQQKSYDGHNGTDFYVLNYPEKTYEVIVPLAGTVIALSEGAEDYEYIDNPELVTGRECGNKVILRHNGILTSKFCHLKKDSIKVVIGQRVKTGEIIGEVGMSGKTEFPHLHFAVRLRDKVFDPISAFHPQRHFCNRSVKEVRESYKFKDSLNFTYLTGIITDLYVSSEIINRDYIYRGEFKNNVITKKTEKFVLWLKLVTVQKNDRVIISINDENAQLVLTKDFLINSDYAAYFFDTIISSNNLSAGEYQIKAELIRDNNIIFSKVNYFTIE